MQPEFLLHKFFKPKKIEDIAKESGEENPFYKNAKLIEAEFSDLVDVMRQDKYLPHPAINKLMTMLWRMVGNRLTPIAISNSVPTIHFWLEAHPNLRSLAVIFVPRI